MVNDYLGLDRNAGLTSALIGTADVEDLLQPWGDDQLFVLTSGPIPPNPSELLGSGQMTNLLARLEQTFDIVIIDAPPLLPVTDAAVLAQGVGGVIVIAGVQKVRRHDLERSLNALSMVGVAILGVVLNRLPSKGPDAYAYSYYSTETPESKQATRQRRRTSTGIKDPALRSRSESTAQATVEGRESTTFPAAMSHSTSYED
jgi:capsular exopolysaccharide synthesis family protein